jgi:hypothetical protein
MEEFNINLVGNDEEIKKEEIFNDFDFNYVPINNLPVSYFPLNNGLLSNELKKINNEVLTGGEDFGVGDINNFSLIIDENKSPYTILVKKNIDCNLNLNGTSRNIRLNKGIYTIIYNFNGYNIIQKNNLDIYKELKGESTNITLNFLTSDNLSNVKKIISNTKKINTSIGISVEPTTDDPNYKLLVYRTSGTITLNKDITCDILLVGGGGSGGLYGGGGGGGGVVFKHNIRLDLGTYNITIGEGGIYKISGDLSSGRRASITTIEKNSIIILAAGGGGNGQSHDSVENTDGILVKYGINNEYSSSGGGGGVANNNSKGIGTLSGNSISGNGGITPTGSFLSSGGGGGANENGYNGTIEKAGNGGAGKISKITGTDTYYGGGGGGSFYNNKAGYGIGGFGGGGAGGLKGDANTGGGGGGKVDGSNSDGGSGIVIFRVKKEDIEEELTNNDFLTSTDTRIINEINNVLEKKMIEFNNEEKPYNYLGIYPLVILIVIFWIFIFLFLLKFVHHYFASIYVYILLFIIIFLLIFGSFWFLYTNNDLL